jgi:hypothetical protein
MGCTYVKEFNFGKKSSDMSNAKSGYSKGGMCDSKPAYAKGGKVTEKATGEVYPSRKAMVKHESEETPRMQREELLQRSKVVAPTRRSVPVAPTGPLIALKKGGLSAVQQKKVGVVMGEFKDKGLHSGKDGEIVSNPKQAVAIALSEARKVGKR